MDYEKRSYRERFSTLERRSFVVSYKQTDLWIAVNKEAYSDYLRQEALRLVIELRDQMDNYILNDPEYALSLIPYTPVNQAPEIMHLMASASKLAEIGPMSAVAGAIAQYVGVALKEKFSVGEIIVENGGDIYAESISDLDVSVFAGSSPLSERVGLHIPANTFPLGICTSSGTVGPSLSFGIADAVMIICKDTMLADSYATAMANLVKTGRDIPNVLDIIREKKEILSAIIIVDDKMGITGNFQLKLFKS
ncbi:MAG TPA: UPF0280 family protein [Bacteroidaceae bacterium]|nr:UPF0280 family protein [Bacteroidaceae bacterium]